MGDPVVDADLSGYDGLDVTSGLGCQVDDDRARFHVVDHVLLDEDGRLLTGDQGRGDHDVHVFALESQNHGFSGKFSDQNDPRWTSGKK